VVNRFNGVVPVVELDQNETVYVQDDVAGAWHLAEIKRLTICLQTPPTEPLLILSTETKSIILSVVSNRDEVLASLSRITDQKASFRDRYEKLGRFNIGYSLALNNLPAFIHLILVFDVDPLELTLTDEEQVSANHMSLGETRLIRFQFLFHLCPFLVHHGVAGAVILFISIAKAEHK